MDSSAEPDSVQARLKSLVERSGALLPAQGPLSGFAFLNPLQGLEDLPFEEGMTKGARLYGCRPYLSEDFYRDKLASGRIVLEDIRAVLQTELAQAASTPVAPSGNRFDVRLAMLQHPLRSAPPEELRWFIAETNALTQFSEATSPRIRKRFLELTRHWVMREVLGRTTNEPGGNAPTPVNQIVTELLERFHRDSMEAWNESTWEQFSLQLLWRVCRQGVELVEIRPDTSISFIRHRDLLLQATGEDTDLLVHPVLIRFCAAFTDQGISDWALPDRDLGLFRAFCTLYQSPDSLRERWMRPLSSELVRLQKAGTTPLACIQESLVDLGVPEDQWGEFIEASTLALRGWAGMIWQMEVRQDRVAKPVPTGSLIEFLAVRLLVERTALRHLSRKHMETTDQSLSGLRRELQNRITRRAATSVEERAFFVFQLAQVMGWSPPDLDRLSPKEWAGLIAEIESFPPLARRRVFQLAFEHRLLVKALDAVSINNQQPPKPAVAARFQSVYCIDAREESFRRHLEEQGPGIETFGAAGFFGVAMYFKGIADAHYSAQCPIVVRPQHWVVEDMAFPFEQSHQFRARSRRALGIAVHQIHLDSRSFAPGAVLSAGLGTLASIPLVMRVLFPKFTARIRRTFGSIVAPPMMTRLRLERRLPAPGPNPGEIGFSIEEMANLGERMLRDIALTSNFARLVFFMGHGSACQNNPHKSTYDCGACTGNPGGPNGRALAAMLNHAKVRAVLASRGLPIPEETIFVGGLHNTCDDTVTLFDLDQLPKSHFEDVAAARRAFDVACRRNAHERCRRFYSARLDLTPDEAHQHVKDRSEDLAQTRPEFGNASNALCIVARRSRSRGLFLDRRCFLQSYDPTTDDAEHTILARILGAVIPVCSGINMQYYLSAVDSLGWGCGTKLPHNITSLLGVMDGAASDLRCGLPIQSVEIHEPVRLLFVIETTPDGILQIMRRNPVIGRILGNGWAQLAVLDPHSNQIQVYQNGEFRSYQPSTTELPTAPSSIEWYRGWRNHLAFAAIKQA
ncbi:MAG: DUF2309 domain-containing protein [Planctomycetes bacterium]|nr:DUF2309 domain-containing protein [Planctomycetota bacterium]